MDRLHFWNQATHSVYAGITPDVSLQAWVGVALCVEPAQEPHVPAEPDVPLAPDSEDVRPAQAAVPRGAVVGEPAARRKELAVPMPNAVPPQGAEAEAPAPALQVARVAAVPVAPEQVAGAQAAEQEPDAAAEAE